MRIVVIVSVLALFVAGCSDPAIETDPAGAVEHTPGMTHTDGMVHVTYTVTPEAPGQSAFGAMQEIIDILEEDPDTDWVQVDIDGLREHLVDMDRLTLYAEVATAVLPDGAAFHATGDARTVAALQRMVPTHTNMTLQYVPGWNATAEITDDGVVLTVTSAQPDEVAHILGLGFFGVMATGAEHPAHHLMMARGMMH